MEWEMVIRLVLAGIFGAIIGFERTSKRKEAGLRTHFLVAVGSALIMMVSKYAFADVLHGKGIALDPSRIAAQVVSGVGFLGAGMIMVQRQSIRGLTTAAGLWATSGIGLAVGAGMYWVSFSTTVLVLLCLEFLHIGFKALSPKYIRVTIHLTAETAIPAVMQVVLQNKVNMFEYQETLKSGDTPEIVLELQLQLANSVDVAALLTELRKISGVRSLRTE